MTNATAPGIPASITRNEYLDLIKALGIDTERLQYLQALEFRWNVIYAELAALDDEGHMVIDGDEIAVHKIAIRVEDPESFHGE